MQSQSSRMLQMQCKASSSVGVFHTKIVQFGQFECSSHSGLRTSSRFLDLQRARRVKAPCLLAGAMSRGSAPLLWWGFPITPVVFGECFVEI